MFTCVKTSHVKKTHSKCENSSHTKDTIKYTTKKTIPPLSPKQAKFDSKFDLSVFTEQPSKNVWDDFIKHRKNLKAPLTQTALNRLAKQINLANSQGYSTDEVLGIIQLQGWKGFDVAWLDNLQRKSKAASSKDWDCSINVA